MALDLPHWTMACNLIPLHREGAGFQLPFRAKLTPKGL
jgi:hypothetical protein